MTIEQKIDKILFACKDRVSHEPDEASIKRWGDICYEVADNNRNTSCPIFKMYLNHLREQGYIDHESYPKAKVNGLLFEGYVAKKNNDKIFGKYTMYVNWSFIAAGVASLFLVGSYIIQIIAYLKACK